MGTNVNTRLPLRVTPTKLTPAMNQQDNKKQPSLASRFIVKFQDATQSRLTAEQVIELLDEQTASVREVFRIHRIDSRGRMELVGVSLATFRQRDCLLFSRHHVKKAREDFDAILELANESPPPCRIDIQFGHVKQPDPSHVVVLIFPTPCTESVGQWLSDAGLQPGDQADGSPAALATYESATPQIVKQHTLAAAPARFPP